MSCTCYQLNAPSLGVVATQQYGVQRCCMSQRELRALLRGRELENIGQGRTRQQTRLRAFENLSSRSCMRRRSIDSSGAVQGDAVWTVQEPAIRHQSYCSESGSWRESWTLLKKTTERKLRSWNRPTIELDKQQKRWN